ncbi:MAG: hypothetical protein K2P80_13775 [Beijerinckiaceae bacterium]|nr:hypothetical protein [Beijerinckiaceae bacterium]
MTHYATSEHDAEDGDYDWDDLDDGSRHEEMLRHDRKRVIYSALAGTVVAFLLIGGAYAWVSTIRKIDTIRAEPATSLSTAGDIEAKLRALAPHEALSISQDSAATQPKKVRAERIETKPD